MSVFIFHLLWEFEFVAKTLVWKFGIGGSGERERGRERERERERIGC